MHREMAALYVLSGADIRAGGYQSWLTIALAVGIAVAAATTFRRVRGTTLAAPAAWCAASALAIALVEIGLARGEAAETSLASSLWRYAAAVGTYCPLMAVLGAKRPQDRGWQWVVAALWVTLLVPAGQSLAASAGNQLELYFVWKLLLVGMTSMALLNYLPTRRAGGAVAFATGQFGLMAPYLGIVPVDERPVVRWAALAVLLAAFPAAGWRKKSPSAPGGMSSDRSRDRWLEFRDGWGAFWALRVMQRINQSAELGGWPVRLRWDGFAPLGADGAGFGDAAIDPRVAKQVEQALDAVLRRFEQLGGSS